MLRSIFAFALLAGLLGGPIASMAASQYASAPRTSVTAETLPDRIVDLFTVSW
jgi:hypothetical protein